ELPAGGSAPAPTPRRLLWLTLVVIAMVGVVVVTVVALVLSGPTSKSERPAELPPSEERLRELLTDGHAALADGAYLRAARQFELALAVGDKLGGRPAAERRHITQLHPQAALLGDLLAESPAA